MSRLTVPRDAAGGAASCDDAVKDREADVERQSVGDLVKNYSDPSEGQKRDRSESGDPAPAGKRGARTSVQLASYSATDSASSPNFN